MTPQSLEQRVESLERRMNALDELPARVGALEAQFLLLRDEMHGEFSALRGELKAGDEETRRVLREEIRAGDDETRRMLREEIRAGDEETRRFMRVLHEDLVARLAVLQNGRRAQPSSRKPRKKT